MKNTNLTLDKKLDFLTLDSSSRLALTRQLTDRMPTHSFNTRRRTWTLQWSMTADHKAQLTLTLSDPKTNKADLSYTLASLYLTLLYTNPSWDFLAKQHKAMPAFLDAAKKDLQLFLDSLAVAQNTMQLKAKQLTDDYRQQADALHTKYLQDLKQLADDAAQLYKAH